MIELSSVETRRVTPGDAEAMAALHIAVWEEAYDGLLPDSVFAERRAGLAERVEHWRRIATESPAPTTIALAGDELVGFVSVGPARDDDVDLSEELWALYVRATWWGRGLGHRLLAEALGDRPAYLWVLEGNDRAIGFYRRQRFTLDGATMHEDHGEHLRMVRP